MVAKITATGILIRFVVALLLVFLTYNPYQFSYFEWLTRYISGGTDSSLPLLAFSGILLLILWTIYLRATTRSLGPFGLFLAFAFFGALLWLAIDTNIISVNNVKLIITLILIIFAGVLAVGMSWSHIRRRISGQSDVDDVDM
jgi:hypothetical protein